MAAARFHHQPIVPPTAGKALAESLAALAAAVQAPAPPAHQDVAAPATDAAIAPAAGAASKRVFVAAKGAPSDFAVMFLGDDWAVFCEAVRAHFDLNKNITLELADAHVRVSSPGEVRDSDKLLASSAS